MDLQQIGVQFVADGVDAFNQALTGAASSVTSFLGSLNPVTAVTGVLNSALGDLGYVMNTLGFREVRLLELAFLRYVNATAAAIIAQTTLKTSLDALGGSVANIAAANLEPFLNQLGSLVTKITPAVDAVVNTLTQWAGGLASDALVWGENVINQFAQGMWNAIGAVIDALIAIANQVAALLSPGSPPKLLPDLTLWGTGAADAWLEGWTQADFKVFDEMGKEVENLLRSMSATGKEKDTNLIPTILGTEDAIAKAVEQVRETGQVTSDALNRIYVAAGATTPELQKYLAAALNLQVANDALKVAQDNLNAVTEHYDDLLQPINEKLAQANANEKTLSDQRKIAGLELILNDPNASASDKALARAAIEKLQLEDKKAQTEAEKTVAVDAANAKVEAAKKAQVEAQLEYDTRKGIIDAITHENKLLQEQEKLMDSLDKAVKAHKGPTAKGPQVTPEHFGGGLADLIPGDIKAKLAELETAFANAWAAITRVMQPAVDAWNRDVIPAWNRLVSAFMLSIPDIETAIAKMVAFTVVEMGTSLPTVFNNVASALLALTQIWTNHHNTILAITVAVWDTIVATILGALTLASGLIAGALQLIAGVMDAGSLLIQGRWQEAHDSMLQTLNTVWTTILGTWNTFLQLALNIVGMHLDTFVSMWTINLNLIWIAITQFGARSLLGWIEFLNAWNAAWVKGWTDIGNTLTGAITGLETAVSTFEGWFNTHVINIQGIIDTWAADFTLRQIIINKAIDAIKQAAQSLFDWLSSHIFNFHINLPQLPDWAIPHSPTPFEIGLRGIADALREVNSIVGPNLRSLSGLAGTAGAVPTGGVQSSSMYNYTANGPQYNYSPTYGGTPPSPQLDFLKMRIFAG